MLKPGDRWHGFEGLAENHVLVDPIKVTILTPGLSANGSMQEHGIPAAVVTKFLSSRRIEIEKTGLYSLLVLFSMGITKGKWSTLITELLNFKDLYDANAPLKRVLPALVEAHPAAYAEMGFEISVSKCTKFTRTIMSPKHSGRCTRPFPRWRCDRPMLMRASCEGAWRALRSINSWGAPSP